MTIPFPRVRIVEPDVALVAVMFAVVAVLGVLLVVQSRELRSVTLERDELRATYSYLSESCDWFLNGSVACPAGTVAVGK